MNKLKGILLVWCVSMIGFSVMTVSYAQATSGSNNDTQATTNQNSNSDTTNQNNSNSDNNSTQQNTGQTNKSY